MLISCNIVSDEFSSIESDDLALSIIKDGTVRETFLWPEKGAYGIGKKLQWSRNPPDLVLAHYAFKGYHKGNRIESIVETFFSDELMCGDLNGTYKVADMDGIWLFIPMTWDFDADDIPMTLQQWASEAVREILCYERVTSVTASVDEHICVLTIRYDTYMSVNYAISQTEIKMNKHNMYQLNRLCVELGLNNGN